MYKIDYPKRIAWGLAVLLGATACNRSSDSKSSKELPATPPQAEGTGFEKLIYRSDDKATTVLLNSPEELELATRMGRFVCKYSKDGRYIRVVSTILGTTQAHYYEIVQDGLRSDDGTFLRLIGTMDDLKEEAVQLNLRQIGIACMAFANDHDDFLPQSLDEIRLNYIKDPQVFTSALAPNDSEPGFEFVTPGANLEKISNPSKTVIVRSRHKTNRGYRVVLYADSHVSSILENQKE